MAAPRVISAAEVAQHAKDGDAWIIVGTKVFDVSKFAALHPGGVGPLRNYYGKDATTVFKLYHSDSILAKYAPRLCIGDVAPADLPPKPRRPPGAFGDLVPYGDPLWYQRFRSPYYKKTHIEWRAKVRKVVEEHVIATYPSWKHEVKPPAAVARALGACGLLATMAGQPYPAEFAPCPAPEGFDAFHELISFDEFARVGYTAPVGALTNGPAIAVTAVLRFGSKELQRMVGPRVFAGDAFIALAVSEPGAGSDVAGLTTTARKEGDHYIINGNKKWITNGTYADWYVTAVRTGGAGHGGLSFILVPKDTPGFTVRKVNIRGSDLTGTAYLDFVDARVPASNLIGSEGDGFRMIMHNFNHERWYLVVLTVRMMRVCIEDSIKYALRRKTFGHHLAHHQAVRMRLARMMRLCESTSQWLEAVTYQMTVMSHDEANLALGDVIALLKAHATKAYKEVATDAVHIFGGNGLYMDGVGTRVEAADGQAKGYAIPGGAEDILEDYAARQAFKLAKMCASM